MWLWIKCQFYKWFANHTFTCVLYFLLETEFIEESSLFSRPLLLLLTTAALPDVGVSLPPSGGQPRGRTSNELYD